MVLAETPQERIEQSSRNFDPGKISKHLKEKGEELLGMAQSGSVLYISVAFILFLLLLIGGMFYGRLVKVAFGVLFVAMIGFILINYWPQLVEIATAIWSWLITENGGMSDANSFGI
jgi:hypothetical protein